ncbi:MAG TPA: gfo/Idh/MocA family oxidoreductase, partial [Lachnospiraceae bacterium]|nr:gfo/Idh/MocA family oxidoreductase [Lachnospiraceae bacterium]
MVNFKIGILGTGCIAEKVADTIAKLDSFEVYAVASRDAEKAAAFAEKFEIKKSYGSYEELVQDSEVELVYVA